MRRNLEEFGMKGMDKLQEVYTRDKEKFRKMNEESSDGGYEVKDVDVKNWKTKKTEEVHWQKREAI